MVKSGKKVTKGLKEVLSERVTKRGYVLTDIIIQGRKAIWDGFEAKIRKLIKGVGTL